MGMRCSKAFSRCSTSSPSRLCRSHEAHLSVVSRSPMRRRYPWPRRRLRGLRTGARLRAPMGFTLPQFGIFAQGTQAHHFLEFDLRPGVSATAAVPSFRRLRTPDVSAGGITLVVGFGADAWREVAPSMTPASLGSFAEVTGPDGHRAPATQHDAW